MLKQGFYDCALCLHSSYEGSSESVFMTPRPVKNKYVSQSSPLQVILCLLFAVVFALHISQGNKSWFYILIHCVLDFLQNDDVGYWLPGLWKRVTIDNPNFLYYICAKTTSYICKSLVPSIMIHLKKGAELVLSSGVIIMPNVIQSAASFPMTAATDYWNSASDFKTCTALLAWNWWKAIIVR